MSDCCNKCGSITLFKGTNGDYVQVTPEPAGANCPEGGLKVEIISGVDDTTVKDTQYVCNGEQGPQGIQGIQGPAGADGADGVDGQGIDHVSRTAGDGSPGTTDTYTVWGDVGETINLGTFTVYNGANGAAGGSLTFESINTAGDPSATINVATAAAGNPAITSSVPNTVYYIDAVNVATVNVEIRMPDSLGTNNGGTAPALGDTIEFIGSASQNFNVRVNASTGVTVGMLLPAATVPADYQEITPPNQFDWPIAQGDTKGLFIKLKYVATNKWIVIDQGWKNDDVTRTVGII